MALWIKRRESVNFRPFMLRFCREREAGAGLELRRGVYFYTIQAGSTTQTGRLLKIR